MTTPPSAEAVDGADQVRFVEELRRTVCHLNRELLRWGLVAWTSGNVSGRVPGADQLVIKPSGVSYDELIPESMVVADLSGHPIGAGLAPSVDTSSHAYIYRELPQVNGIVHTHSTFATAWAARHEAIPCVLTAMADEFGGEIPLAPFALIGGNEIGEAVVSTLRGHRSPAVLLAGHGVISIGSSPVAAVKAAVMCEDVARTVHHARALGTPVRIEQADVDRLHERYRTSYGQR